MSEFEQNLGRATATILTRFQRCAVRAIYGGEFYTNDKTLTNLTPVDNTSIVKVSKALRKI